MMLSKPLVVLAERTRDNPAQVVLAALGATVVYVVWKWRAEAQRIVGDIQVRTGGRLDVMPMSRMTRVKKGGGMERMRSIVDGELGSGLFAAAKTFDLSESWVAKRLAEGGGGGGTPPPGKPPIGLCSLSDYLSTLRLQKRQNTEEEHKEMDAIVAQALLSALGPSVGSALAPLIGAAGVGKALVEKVAGMGVGHVGHGGPSVAGTALAGVFSALDSSASLSLLFLGSLADTLGVFKMAGNTEKRVEDLLAPVKDGWAPPKKKEDSSDALSYMFRGEATSPTFPADVVPNPFVIERHWEPAISHMIDQERKGFEARNEAYDPDGYPVDYPTPVNENILPGLYKGFGGVIKTLNNRQQFCARLLCILLNKLAANDARSPEERKGKAFTVVISVEGKDREVSDPAGFVEALQATGHEIKVQSGVYLVSFGMGLCVKEDDGSWTNIPVGAALRTGYEDSGGRTAEAFLTHGGLCMNLSGPLVGKRCEIAHYHAIDGYCGWYTNECSCVPWLTETCWLGDGPLTGQKALKAVVLANLLSVVLNCVDTRLDPPNNGYALTGVCQDSAAVIEKVLFGRTDVYPIMSIGRFYRHSIREAEGFCKSLEQTGDKRLPEMKALVNSMWDMPNDIHAQPRATADAIRRMKLCTPPNRFFKIMEESYTIAESILEEERARAH